MFDIFSSERLEEATPEGHAATFMSLTFSRKRRNSGGGVRHIVRYVFKKGSQSKAIAIQTHNAFGCEGSTLFFGKQIVYGISFVSMRYMGLPLVAE
jgi:hypothetical protein